MASPPPSDEGLSEGLQLALVNLATQRDRAQEAFRALVEMLPKCARGCRRIATTTDGDGAYHCDPHRPPSELTVSVDLPWAKLVREEKLTVQP
jgi:hypothetical protein